MMENASDRVKRETKQRDAGGQEYHNEVAFFLFLLTSLLQVKLQSLV